MRLGRRFAALDCFASLAMTKYGGRPLVREMLRVWQYPTFVIARSAATKQSRAMQRDFQPAVYIMASRRNGTTYVGVTSNLPQRVWQHREGLVAGFTKRHECKALVWFELHATMEHAIKREKQLKGGPRRRKLVLIEAANPTWRDLFAEVCA